ncbi:MAG: transcription elongation factor GreA [Candidatus Omnitrophota bacterium]|jgi:transcription elongation factor GreA
MPEYITKEELEELKKELEHLKTIKTREIADLIRHAASFGDLKENFAYHEAKEKQGFLHGKILELQEKIRSAQIIEKTKSDKIQIGSDVLVKIEKDEQNLIIVSPSQADPIKGKISNESPIGEAIMGKKAGDKVKINIGGERLDCEILKVE